MPFEPGNQWWRMRETHGRPGMFETAQDLKEAIESYFAWNEANPLLEDSVSFYQGAPTHDKVEKMRAMTIEGLCLHIGITRECWRLWKTNTEKPSDFLAVIDWAESVMKYQKFTGAAAGLLNANIISRDLGLADKQDLTSSDGSMTPKEPRTLDDFYASDVKPKP